MSKNNVSDNFDNINYQEYNENQSIYESAIENREDQENISFSIKDKEITKKNDLTKRNTNNLLNATIYNKKNLENRSNKFVNDNTMSSYLSITDLQEDARDNVNILKSNISKIYERDDRINELTDKTDSLFEGATLFNKKSSLLKNKMFWANVINALLIIFFIILIIFLIIKLT